MPDPQLREDVQLEGSERLQSTRQPINDLLGYHEFQESEFDEGAGRCDKCGGGPLAQIHQKPIDHGEQLKRIAEALESISTAQELTAGEYLPTQKRIADALERTADVLERPYRMGAFWRVYEWAAHFFSREGTLVKRSELRDEIERVQVQMAGISAAAGGATKDPATCDMWGWSPAYQDVLELRLKYEELLRKSVNS